MALASSLAPSPARAQELTNKEKAAILSVLNHQRAKPEPPGDTALPMLVWDAGLEAIAQNWALTCTPDAGGSGLLGHNPNRSDGYSGTVGENVSGSPVPFNKPYTVVDLVNLWTHEARDYNFSENTCAGEPNSIHANWKRCGHYTQIVWETTTRVGCGVNVCPNLKYPSALVCDFSTAGNTYNPGTGALDRPYTASAAPAEPRSLAPRR